MPRETESRAFAKEEKVFTHPTAIVATESREVARDVSGGDTKSDKSGQTLSEGQSTTAEGSNNTGLFSNVSSFGSGQGTSGGGDGDDNHNPGKKNLPADKFFSGSEEDSGSEEETPTEIKNNRAPLMQRREQPLPGQETYGKIGESGTPETTGDYKDTEKLNPHRYPTDDISSESKAASRQDPSSLPHCSDDNQQEQENVGLGNGSEGTEQDCREENIRSQKQILRDCMQRCIAEPDFSEDGQIEPKPNVVTPETTPRAARTEGEETYILTISQTRESEEDEDGTLDNLYSSEDELKIIGATFFSTNKGTGAPKRLWVSTPPYKVRLQSEIKRHLRDETGGISTSRSGETEDEVAATAQAAVQVTDASQQKRAKFDPATNLDQNIPLPTNGHAQKTDHQLTPTAATNLPTTTLRRTRKRKKSVCSWTPSKRCRDTRNVEHSGQIQARSRNNLKRGKRNCSSSGGTNADYLPIPKKDHLNSTKTQEKTVFPSMHGGPSRRVDNTTEEEQRTAPKQPFSSSAVCSDALPINPPANNAATSIVQQEAPEASLEENYGIYVGVEVCLRCPTPVDEDHDVEQTSFAFRVFYPSDENYEIYAGVEVCLDCARRVDEDHECRGCEDDKKAFNDN